MDPLLLVELARIQLRGGELPHERYSLVYGGVSSGRPCRLCRKPIKRGEDEVELMWLQGGPGREAAHLHHRCYEAWRTATKFPLITPTET